MSISRTGILNSCHQDVTKKRGTQEKEVNTFPAYYTEAAKNAMEEYAQKKVAEYLKKVKNKIEDDYDRAEWPITCWLDKIDDYIDELMKEYKFTEI